MRHGRRCPLFEHVLAIASERGRRPRDLGGRSRELEARVLDVGFARYRMIQAHEMLALEQLRIGVGVDGVLHAMRGDAACLQHPLGLDRSASARPFADQAIEFLAMLATR
jgi:hypothetical protein